MAAKSVTEPDKVQDTAAIADPWSIKKEITLPRARMGEASCEYVSVNGNAFQVPKGKPVEVPEPIYEVLMRKLLCEEEEAAYKRELETQADDVSGAGAY